MCLCPHNTLTGECHEPYMTHNLWVSSNILKSVAILRVTQKQAMDLMQPLGYVRESSPNSPVRTGELLASTTGSPTPLSCTRDTYVQRPERQLESTLWSWLHLLPCP